MDLSLYSGGDMLAFNDSITRPQVNTNLKMTIGEGACERKVILNFLVIPCQSALKGILGRSLLEMINAVTSLIHLKETYHNVEESSVIVRVDVDEEKWTKKII